MIYYAHSDIGKAREKNQDSFYIPKEEDKLKLFALADGMGGYKGGEVASKLAIISAKNYLETNFEKIEHSKEAILELIRSSIEYANMVVYEKSKEDDNLSGMGTTLELCLIYNNRAYIGHVGDSRIYRIRKNIIRKLTNDHSYVEKLVKDGKISKEEAVYHPKKNMLTKALGCGAFVEPDVMVKGFQKEDIIILSSDGLTNMVSNEEIFDEVIKNIKDASKNLVDKANEYGGYDNITIVVVKN
ncbi:MAG: Stp1/IreP family PP2C-type Ser/Thr phosphatase [Clostridia bacterium]|nr:Stp1/IreP family PP2C-type Ser/Thr phosphatase [Clostridia bacterium]